MSILHSVSLDLTWNWVYFVRILVLQTTEFSSKGKQETATLYARISVLMELNFTAADGENSVLDFCYKKQRRE
jgi:hypothetical protein